MYGSCRGGHAPSSQENRGHLGGEVARRDGYFAAAGFSIGAPMMLPHSVHEPS